MDELTRKENFLQAITATEIAPMEVSSEVAMCTYTKLPLTKLTSLGVGFETMSQAVQKVTQNGQGVSGYYKVTIPPGTHLARFKGSKEFLGTALADRTNDISNQARLSPMTCDPTMMLMAATLASIDKKLDAIQETQQEMMDFIIQKEKSALKGDMDFLIDVFNNYKYNWNNDKYKAANHIKVLDIRQENGKRIDFYREQIKKHLGKKTFLHSDQDVKKQMNQIQEEFRDYQLSLYLYGFSYYLEILLQENYDALYLENISKKIDSLSMQYRELYTVAYTMIEDRAKSSLQAKVIGGLSVANKVTGEAIAKVPVISKSQIDEGLIGVGEKLSAYENKREKDTMKRLVEHQSSCVRPFIEQIEAVNRVYNNTITLVFSEEMLYIGTN